MGRIAVFGAGGRAGRAAVGEARRRGHQVTAVVRDPAEYGDLAAGGVRLVAGDVTDVDSVARVAVGHDAAISAVYDAGAQPDVFFTGAARALLDGLARAGVGRLLVVGLASVLKTAAGVDALRAATTELDWLVVSPAGDFDHGGGRTGRYRAAAAEAASRVSYADFAVALLDEIDTPKHHRSHLGVEAG
jgi:uncharacterized protein